MEDLKLDPQADRFPRRSIVDFVVDKLPDAVFLERFSTAPATLTGTADAESADSSLLRTACAFSLVALAGGLLVHDLGFDPLSPGGPAAVASSAVSAPASPPTKPIEQIRLGERVVAHNPLRHEVDRSAEPDPATWRMLRLTMTKPDGGRLDLELLRPLDWVEAASAAPGSVIDLDLPELGAAGPAEVLSIDPCPPIADGSGKVVTGRFAHQSAEVLDLVVSGSAEPIGTTANHPFWSEDRQEFVPADLRIGETLRTATGHLAQVTVLTRLCPLRPQIP